MKKKVKKIPKYNKGVNGVIAAEPPVQNVQEWQSTKDFWKISDEMDRYFNAQDSVAQNTYHTDKSLKQGIKMPSGIAQVSNKALMDIAGIENNSTAGVMLNKTAEFSDVGGSIVPGWGHLIGGAVGALVGGLQKGSVDENTGEITYGGIFGHSAGYLRRKSNIIKNSNLARQQTQNLQADYYNQNPMGSVDVLAAEGGIMRKPVDALVSKGELIYNPITKKLSKVPGSKGKPNKADDVYARLYEGDVVISNSPTMIMANGKTPAQNLEGFVDKYSTGGTVKAREAIIKKVVNWQEANKTKPQEYAKFDEGWNGEIKSWDDYLKRAYSLSKNNKIDKLDDFWGYDSKNKKYNSRWRNIIEHIGSNEALREKAIKDLGGLSYIGTGKDAWDNIVKAANDLKVGDVHRYFRSIGDVLSTNMDPLSSPIVGLGRTITVPKGVSQKNVRSSIGGVDHMTSYIPQQESEKLTKLTPQQIKQFGERDAALLKDTPKSGSKKSINWLNEMSNLLPLVGGLFDKYDWHTEQPQISPAKYIPVNANATPLLRAADESLAMARYNQANINPNTGAGMAYGLQVAANRAKQYADAYQWQQETNNKLIAQNADIYNNWRRQRDAYATQAIADTRANEGAAQQMKDQARKDRLEFYYGKRNDDMRLAALSPLAQYAFDDNTYRKIYKRGIV